MNENHLFINRHTLAIRKIEHPEFQSEIIHADGVQYAVDSPVKILFDYCMLTGSTLKGSMDGSRHKLGEYSVYTESGDLSHCDANTCTQ